LKPFGQVKDSENEKKGRVKWSGFVYEGGVSYKVGDAIFVMPPASKVDSDLEHYQPKNADENVYPELYRKSKYVKVRRVDDTDKLLRFFYLYWIFCFKGSNLKTAQPFDIGIIIDIYSTTLPVGKVKLRIRNLYRPSQVRFDLS